MLRKALDKELGKLFIRVLFEPKIKRNVQAFRFIVGPVHSPMISKYGPSLSKAVGSVDPSFLVVKISGFNKKYSSYNKSTNSKKQKVHVGCHYSRTCLKQPLKKGQNRDLNKKWQLNEGPKDCRKLPLEHSAILLTCIKG